MYTYNRFTLLYTWNYHNIVNQLYSNKNFLKKKEIKTSAAVPRLCIGKLIKIVQTFHEVLGATPEVHHGARGERSVPATQAITPTWWGGGGHSPTWCDLLWPALTCSALGSLASCSQLLGNPEMLEIYLTLTTHFLGSGWLSGHFLLSYPG